MFAFAEEEAAKIEAGLRIGLGEVGLPVDRGLVGPDSVGRAPESFEGEAEVVLDTYVAGTELDRARKSVGSVRIVVLVLLRAAEEVPKAGSAG